MLLAIESSCDESALALFDPAKGIVGEWVHSQISLHEAYGGVVPDLASREHLKNFFPLLEASDVLANRDAISEIAVTNGPGLAGCLASASPLRRVLALRGEFRLKVSITCVDMHIRLSSICMRRCPQISTRPFETCYRTSG